LVPKGAGVDAKGESTTDPAAILDGGALLPFAGPKGANIAFMVEVLVAAFGGGHFGFEASSNRHPEAETSRTGQFLLLLDPGRGGASGFDLRIQALLAALTASGTTRFPGDRRRVCRARARAEGITIGADVHESLLRMARVEPGRAGRRRSIAALQPGGTR
jgi:delta1-piperideine-2-carboxylate reductase